MNRAMLVADDDADLRDVMATILAGEGYAVLVPNPFYRVAKAPQYETAANVDFAAPETRAKLDSSVADLRSTGGSDRSGGALLAAAFLREFVETAPWAHLDIAGPAFRTGSPEGAVSTGGTGVAVTTLVELARSMAG